MLELLISIAGSIPALLAVGNEAGSCWTVDRATVMRGGCLTVIVQKRCNESSNLMLQIDARRPIKLLDGAGPKFHRRVSRLPGRDVTLVLLFRDFTDMEAFEEIPGEPDTFRPVPLFDKPGIVLLTLYDGRESLGTNEVRVIPSTDEAEAALKLLYPALTPKKKASREDSLWRDGGCGELFGFSPPLTDRELEVMRELLPIVMQHPDWAEIAEMQFAGNEARHYQRLVTDEDLHLKKDVPVAEFPAIVTECATKPVRNPFAQGIQDRLVDVVSFLYQAAGERAGPRLRAMDEELQKRVYQSPK